MKSFLLSADIFALNALTALLKTIQRLIVAGVIVQGVSFYFALEYNAFIYLLIALVFLFELYESRKRK